MRSDDRAACWEHLRRGSTSFYAASHLLPRRVRGAAAATYAFCRVADDVVDEGTSLTRVDTLRARLDRVYADGPRMWEAALPASRPIERAFREVVHEYRIPRAILDGLLEGFQWDVDERRYETLSDVRAYCARVAATVGVIMTKIMGGDGGDAGADVLARACDLGVAMQLTNIARDVGEDARNGRLYIPEEWMREVGLDPTTWMKAPTFSPSIADLVERLLEEAERLYRRSEAGIRALPRDCRRAIWGARLVYADIGRSIEQNGFDSVSSRAFTTRRRKARLLFLAIVRALGRTGLPVAGLDEAPLSEVVFLIEQCQTGSKAP